MRKVCSKCRDEKSVDDFPDRKRNKDGKNEWCKSCVNFLAKIYREGNREKVRASGRATHHKHKEKRVKHTRDWMLANPDKRRAWRVRSAKEIYEYNREWDSNNKDKRRFYKAKRRSSKKNATPVWVDFRMIEKIYKECLEVSELLGETYHVDHIVPLQHNLVCGLHVPWNLQILRAFDNHSKKNKFIVE